jgi:hypothetical protein
MPSEFVSLVGPGPVLVTDPQCEFKFVGGYNAIAPSGTYQTRYHQIEANKCELRLC